MEDAPPPLPSERVRALALFDGGPRYGHGGRVGVRPNSDRSRRICKDSEAVLSRPFKGFACCSQHGLKWPLPCWPAETALTPGLEHQRLAICRRVRGGLH